MSKLLHSNNNNNNKYKKTSKKSKNNDVIIISIKVDHVTSSIIKIDSYYFVTIHTAKKLDPLIKTSSSTYRNNKPF